MKIDANQKPQETMKGTVEKFGLREESNRTFLIDKQQQTKSVFSIGSVRHNVHSKQMADEMNRNAGGAPQRLIQWDEAP